MSRCATRFRIMAERAARFARQRATLDLMKQRPRRALAALILVSIGIIITAATATTFADRKTTGAHPRAYVVARSLAPAGGTFELRATFPRRPGRSPQRCFNLIRRYPRWHRHNEYDLTGCASSVPARRKLRGVPALNCDTGELDVVGIVDRKAGWVEAVLSGGRRADANLYSAPRLAKRGTSMFALIIKDQSDWAPQELRAYGRTGRLLGVQRLGNEAGLTFDCFPDPLSPGSRSAR